MAKLEHSAVIVIVAGVDLVFVSKLVHGDYVVRGLAALILWILAQFLAPLQSPFAAPSWGSFANSIKNVFQVAIWVFGLFSIAASLLFLFANPVSWYRPLVISNLDDTFPFILSGVVAAPVVEEFIYRGILYARMRAFVSMWPAILVSGLVFWSLHWVSRGDFSSPHHLFAGILLAWSYEETRSLLAPTILHALGNLSFLGLDWLWLFLGSQ